MDFTYNGITDGADPIPSVSWQTYRNHLIFEYEIPKYDGDLGIPNVFNRVSVTLVNQKLANVGGPNRSLNIVATSKLDLSRFPVGLNSVAHFLGKLALREEIESGLPFIPMGIWCKMQYKC